MFNPQAACGPV